MKKSITRIAVFVSGGGTNLQALIDAARAGIIKSGEIALVLSNRAGAYALERARAAGIPTAHLPRQALAHGLEPLMRAHEIDMIVLAGFLCILPAHFTRLYEKRIINVHPALIPAFSGEGYYGLRVHEAALARGVKVTGATVHYVNEVCDGGEIIAQRAVAVRAGDTPETLQERVMRMAEWRILPRAVEKVAREIRNERI
ncbi:MAG: phosphoribosylglycinamide formyltransferase [Christensenellales bacterium]|jgi:phosphoribosylglycinamide formyltransferase-1